MKETRRIFCNYDAHLSIAIAASEQGYRVDPPPPARFCLIMAVFSKQSSRQTRSRGVRFDSILALSAAANCRFSTKAMCCVTTENLIFFTVG